MKSSSEAYNQGLEVILVFYPGHLAMAVHFTGGAKGDYLSAPLLVCFDEA